ncbi:hypothetical protein ABBQ38_003710 [Trebouxia sp. C0009 RCD-2024]
MATTLCTDHPETLAREAKIKLASHGLPIVTGRFSALQPLRQQYATLFSPETDTMRSFFAQRVKEAWSRQRNVELCEMAAKGASRFWRLFKTPHSNACPVELSAQFAAFRALMGAEPMPAPTRHATSGAGGTWCY